MLMLLHANRMFEICSILLIYLNQSIIINGLLLIIIDYIDCNQSLIFIN